MEARKLVKITFVPRFFKGIASDGPFDIPNGLSGTGHLVLSHICLTIQQQSGVKTEIKDQKIRAVIGLCQEHLEIKDCNSFKRERINFSLIKDSLIMNFPMFPGSVEVHGYSVTALKLSGTYVAAFSVINKVLEDGVYLLTCTGNMPISGLVLNGRLEDHVFTLKNYVNIGLRGALVWQNGFTGGNTLCERTDTRGVEIDMDDRTIHAFVNGMLQPVSYAHIPAPMMFYLSLCNVGDVGRVLSFRRLPRSSVTESTPTASIYDPDNAGFTAQVVEWSSADNETQEVFR